MAAEARLVGHTVEVRGRLKSSDDGGLKAPIMPGSRSVAYLFSDLDPNECDKAGFGAVVEAVLDGGAPGGDVRAILHFWADLAQVYATSGAQFDFWMGRVVGHGQVVRVCDAPGDGHVGDTNPSGDG